MLEEIHISGHATYSADGQTLSPCKTINFIFGTNGSGKTTISRVVGDPGSYPASRLKFTGDQVIERLVYNSNFVERNFTSSMKGIFTLGEQSADAITKITAAKALQGQLEQELRGLNGNLNGSDENKGKIAELGELRNRFEEACWTTIKSRHDDSFRDVFEDAKVRGKKARFSDKVIAEWENNIAQNRDLDDLRARAKSVFQKELASRSLLGIPAFTDILQLETAPALSKVVVGKDDVDVSSLIKHLGNSDWVQQGRSYLDSSGNLCPFCQQGLLTDLARDLDDYFDETYAADIRAIDRVQAAYKTHSSIIVQTLERIAASEGDHLSADTLRADIDRLTQRVARNLQQLESKKKEPSTVIALEALDEVTTALADQISAANAKIQQHNELVENISAEKSKLITEVWRFILDESKAMIDAYLTEKGKLDKAISGLGKAIQAKKTKLGENSEEIAGLERSITSVQPTVTAINAILASFGFTGFKLATAGERGNFYKIIRLDGSDALNTLSEGEKAFITFLYFYHLIRGSVSETGVTSDRIVVFDDPVSSLDSDVLFIVSSLIRRIFEDACEGKGSVKQVFVLTHNIYFHKEVSFDPKRGENSRTHETFWIVRKQSNISVLKHYDYNPIKTSYELLWSEVRNSDRSYLTIQNTLRRILESYFKILGNLDRDEIVNMFSGSEKQVCGSLFSWMHDGSHSVHDELYISTDNAAVERYLDVFRKIFEKTNHMAHYHMMMGSSPSGSPSNVAEVESLRDVAA